MSDPDSIDAETSFITFAEETLGFRLYDWQADALEPFDDASLHLVLESLATPNGSGKSAVVIPSLVLGWLAMYPKGRVVVTTADGKQLDGQLMPAIEAHRGKFPAWHFIERQITTPTGGRFVAFTTDDAGRAEGWHKLDDTEGPLLIIADEAKTIPEAIFTAIDRCTFNALLLTSSPGYKRGRFYESQFKKELGFNVIRVGLKDCPHITPDKINRIIAQHGEDSPFTRSTLHGEFMESTGEARFDREGLKHLADMAATGHERALIGSLEQSRATGSAIFIRDDAGWIWLDEAPQPGGEYLIFCDPNTCEQGEGTEDRDNTACGVIRAAWIDDQGVEHNDQLVAALHWPGGVKWDSDVLAKRMKLLSAYYGGAMAVVEENNFGSALMKDLQREGVPLWVRTKIDDVNPNKQLKIVGFKTTQRSREHWVQAGTTAVREQSFVCRYKPACEEFQTFIILPSGRAEAQAGCHDDWVAGIGIGLLVRCFSKIPFPQRQSSFPSNQSAGQSMATGLSKFGSCG